jgi:hypothetical protein
MVPELTTNQHVTTTRTLFHAPFANESVAGYFTTGVRQGRPAASSCSTPDSVGGQLVADDSDAEADLTTRTRLPRDHLTQPLRSGPMHSCGTFHPGDASSILVLALNDRLLPFRDLGH